MTTEYYYFSHDILPVQGEANGISCGHQQGRYSAFPQQGLQYPIIYNTETTQSNNDELKKIFH